MVPYFLLPQNSPSTENLDKISANPVRSMINFEKSGGYFIIADTLHLKLMPPAAGSRVNPAITAKIRLPVHPVQTSVTHLPGRLLRQ